MTHSIIREVDALVSLSRTQSRLAQEYRRMAVKYSDDAFDREHDRLRMESVRHMRSAHSWRDRYYATKEATVMLEAAE